MYLIGPPAGRRRAGAAASRPALCRGGAAPRPQGHELFVGASVAREVEHRAGGFVRRDTVRHQVGQYGDWHHQRPVAPERLQPLERGRRHTRAERPGGGSEIGFARASAERLACAAELAVERPDRVHDAVTRGPERAAFEGFLDQRLGRQALVRGAVHHPLHCGGGGGIEALGETVVLRSGTSGQRQEQQGDPAPRIS